MRRLVHEGTPLHTIGIAMLRDISLRCEELDKLTESQKEWICRLLKIGISPREKYNNFEGQLIIGYLAIEALDSDDEMSQICIYCGIITEVVLGEL